MAPSPHLYYYYLSISRTIFLVQWNIFSRISGAFLKNHHKERSNYFYVFECSGKTFDFYEWKHENYITRHILKMAAVQASKRRLATVTLVDKYKALKEIDEGQSCVATAKKNTVLLKIQFRTG